MGHKSACQKLWISPNSQALFLSFQSIQSFCHTIKPNLAKCLGRRFAKHLSNYCALRHYQDKLCRFMFAYENASFSLGGATDVCFQVLRFRWFAIWPQGSILPAVSLYATNCLIQQYEPVGKSAIFPAYPPNHVYVVSVFVRNELIKRLLFLKKIAVFSDLMLKLQCNTNTRLNIYTYIFIFDWILDLKLGRFCTWRMLTLLWLQKRV